MIQTSLTLAWIINFMSLFLYLKGKCECVCNIRSNVVWKKVMCLILPQPKSNYYLRPNEAFTVMKNTKSATNFKAVISTPAFFIKKEILLQKRYQMVQFFENCSNEYYIIEAK